MTPLASMIMASAALALPLPATFATKQPPAGPLKLATANPITAGIFFAATPTDTSLSPVVDANAGPIAALDHLGQACTAWCSRAVSDGDRSGVHFDVPRIDGKDWTIVVLANNNYITGYGAHPFIDFYGDWNNRMGPCCVIYGKGGNAGIDVRPNGGDLDAYARMATKANCEVQVFRMSGSTGKIYYYISGQKTEGTMGTNSCYVRRVNFFGKNGESGDERGDIRITSPLAIGWNRAITDAEQDSIIANPWQIYPG